LGDEEDEPIKCVEENKRDKELDYNPYKKGNLLSCQRLLSELRAIKDAEKFGISAEPVDDDLSIWEVKLFDFGEDTPLHADLQKYKSITGKDYITLRMMFKSDYPFSPPFVYVVTPKFIRLTARITSGGSICSPLLTSHSWIPTQSIEGILVSIKMDMIEGGAKLDLSDPKGCYRYEEAFEAYNRVSKRYGWN